MSDFLQEGDLSHLESDSLWIPVVQSDLVDINLTDAEIAQENDLSSAAQKAVDAHKAAGKPINGKTVW